MMYDMEAISTYLARSGLDYSPLRVSNVEFCNFLCCWPEMNWTTFEQLETPVCVFSTVSTDLNGEVGMSLTIHLNITLLLSLECLIQPYYSTIHFCMQ